MYWFLYDANGNLKEAHINTATKWTNLNGYAGALSIPEERTDLVIWQASTAYNTGDTLSTGGYYYTCEVTDTQPTGQNATPANLSGTTEPTFPTTIGATVVDNDLTWTCSAEDLSPMAADAFANPSYYTVQTSTVTNSDGTTSQVAKLIKTVTDAQLFSIAQQSQLALLDKGLNDTLNGGFTAKTLVGSATTPHTYPSDGGAQSNFSAAVSAFTANPNKTTVTLQTLDAGWVSHTKAEFYGVYSDGDSWKEAQYPQLSTLQAKVNAMKLSDYATLDDAIAAVQAVVWTAATY